MSSSTTIMDSFDAPMLDYSGDMDVHMHTTVSSPKPWTPAETIMEEDVHPIPLPNPFPSHPQQDVEIDMDDYYNENVEYEMADGEIAVPDTELVDIDVYDAPREDAFSASAPISLSTGLTNQNIDKKTVGDHYLPSDIGVATGHIPADPDPNPLDRKSADPELLTPTIPQETVLQDRDVKLSHQASATIAPRASTSPLEAVSEDLHSSGDNSVAPEGHTIPLPVIAITDSKSSNLDTSQPLDESEQTKVLESSTVEHESSASVPQIVTPRAIDEGSPHQAEIQNGESHEGVRVPDEGYEGVPPGTIPDITDAIEPARPVVESHEVREEDNGDPHEISEGVYIEPPPPVLIELPSSSDQLVCALFNAPAILPSDDKEVNASRTGTSYIVLLQNRPTLYYETLNDVFDALREEERIQSMAEFVDGEMVIDAFDLQLVVSEDNVHAREISLHDLNILHHGLGFVGPLRLRIRAVFSRFIYRYRSLQDQIKRFNVSSTRHPAEDEYEYEGPPPERDGQTKRELTGDGDHEGLTEGDVDEPEDVESTDHGHAEYQDEDEEEAYGESEQYADTQEYPPAHEDEAGTREETDQFVANDESEFVPDADGAHQGADPDLTEYQERDEEYEQDGVSGDVQATSPITVSMRAKESVLPGTELEVLTEVRESGTTGDYPQPEESEERQVNTELSSPHNAHEDEQTEADGPTEDAEAEDDTTGDDSAQPTDPGNLADVTNEEDQDDANHDNTEYSAQEAELATPAISLRGEFSESVNSHHHTEEDEENAESWELDDGYADWEETIDGDELDIALVGEPDSVSSGSSTLSGKTASITSKRSFDEVDPTIGQSSLQSPKKTRMR